MKISRAEVFFKRGRARVYLNGSEVPPVLYALSDIPASRSTTEQAQRNIRNFGSAGINLVQIDLNLRDAWLPDGITDVSEAIRQISAAESANPQCAVILRLHMNPPPWWLAAHSEEETVYGEGEGYVEDIPDRLISGDGARARRVSIASERWQEEAEKHLHDFCVQLESHPAGGCIAGIQPACGMFGEWHSFGGGEYSPDYSPAQLRAFRAFLREKYGSDEELRSAWHQPGASIESAMIPLPSARRTAHDGYFRDPRKEQAVSDSLISYHRSHADAMLRFCRTVKTAWRKPVITGSFFGYYFGVDFIYGGHLEIDRVLRASCIDYLAAPLVYGKARLPGHSGHSRGVLESVRLHQKLWLTEMDQHPEGAVLETPGGDPARDPETIGLMRRNIADCLTRGHGFWYYDHRIIPPDNGSGDTRSLYIKNGWWDTPALMAEVAREQQLYERFCRNAYESDAEILCVWSSENHYYHAYTDVYTYQEEYLFDFLEVLGRGGAPVDDIYISDLSLVDLSTYKVIFFFNSSMVPPESRARIAELRRNRSIQIIFFYADGYSDGSRNGVDIASEFCGIQLRKLAESALPISFGDERLNVSKPYCPAICPDDPEAEVLACFTGTNQPAAVRKQNLWYCAYPMLSEKMLEEILNAGGIHRYSLDGLNVKVGSGILALHAGKTGSYILNLRDGRSIKCRLNKAETAIFDSEEGERIL